MWITIEDELLRDLMKDESMYMDEALFYAKLQEEPIPVQNNRCKSQHFRLAGKNVQFKGIYECAVIIRRLYESKEKVFNLPKTNKSQTVKKLCSLLYTNSRAGLEKRKDISEHSHPWAWKYIEHEKDLEKEIYLCRQSDILTYAVKAWGITNEAKRTTIPSDYCRFIGIFLLDELKDVTDMLQGQKKTIDAHDDPQKQKVGIFADIAKKFNDKCIIISNPKDWDRCHHLNGFDAIDPNDYSRVSIKRTGGEMKLIYDKISVDYKKAMKNYTKGTGGGSGAPENFEVWEERDATKYFDNYANHTNLDSLGG